MIQARARKPECVSKGAHSWTKHPEVRRVQFFAHEKLFERLHALAIEDGLSMSALARSLICDGLAVRAAKNPGGTP